MTLTVPLALRVGDKHLTRQVQSLSFRREAIGGVRSIAFNLARPLSDLDGIDPLAKVYVYDTRTATTVAEGRLADSGRTASPEGQRWECVAFGPAQSAADWSGPLIFVDRDLSAWKTAVSTNPEFSFGTGSKPDGSVGASGLVGTFREGITLGTAEYLTARYDRIQAAGQKVGGFLVFQRVNGVTFGAYWLDYVVANTDWSGAYIGFDTSYSDSFTTTPVTRLGSAPTNFGNGRDILDLQMRYTGAGGTNGADVWTYISAVIVRAMMYDQAGTELTPVYTAGTIEPQIEEVVADLLGRPGLMDEFDGANATIAVPPNAGLSQLAYPDGVTPEQVLTDLMSFAPAYRWYSTPDVTGNGYGFSFDEWPTTVRYEATLDDGGSFPLSTQSVYNEVAVRWTDAVGTAKTTIRTRACEILDNAGLTRRATIDLGGEAGSFAQAEAAGDAFLLEHNVPKNGGTLTVARPIRDVISGSLVQPWEIEAGELVRVLGVEAYPDAFNASTNDGQGVFRIHAVDYTSDGNTATLALDSDARETEDALVALMKERRRR